MCTFLKDGHLDLPLSCSKLDVFIHPLNFNISEGYFFPTLNFLEVIFGLT